MNNRPVASLGPTLLARKGSARPAMRPQVAPLRQDNTARQLDDLGWNDMGNDTGNDEAAALAPLPAPPPVRHVAEIVELNPGLELPPARQPEVLRQQAEIAERIAKPRRSAVSDGRRAAFTLRLDPERHLKLRLACITRDRSAQQIVIEALDRLIADLPDVADLAAKVRQNRR